MAREKFQKIKLLKLWEILCIESDKEHPLDTITIIDKLKSYGICCDRKTLYRDIQDLTDQGYKVQKKREKRNLYYAEHSAFSLPELRILIDAVQSAHFITVQKTNELVDKIATLAGMYKGDTLKNGVYFDVQKSSNEAIYNNILTLDEAINLNQKVSFKYFHYNENGEFVYRKEGGRYLVNPVALVFNNDCYYFVCYSDKYKNLSNYRVDRIADVAIENEKIEIADCAVTFDIAEYRRKTFSMFTGKEAVIELEFDKSLIDVMMDKFGSGIKIKILDNGNCSLRAHINISPVFFGWCANFGDQIVIKHPDAVRLQYQSYIKKILQHLEKNN